MFPRFLLLFDDDVEPRAKRDAGRTKWTISPRGNSNLYKISLLTSLPAIARLKQLNEAFREESTSQSRARDSQRSQLIGGRQPMGGSSNPWQEEEESEETRGLTNDEMIVQHQQIMRGNKNELRV